MGFNIVHLSLTIAAVDPIRLVCCLPFLSKEYAVTCRSLACRWPDRDCETCSRQENCGWYLVFGQKLATDPSALKRYQKPPLPFVFSFPLLTNTSPHLKEIECGLVVVGSAIPYLEMLLQGFADLLSGSPGGVMAHIRQVVCLDYQGSVLHSARVPVVIPSGKLTPDNLVIASTEGLLESSNWSSSGLHLRMKSPLRLLEDGHLLKRFHFGLFARSVMRRVSSLTYYYGEGEFDCDFKELSRNIDDVSCTMERYSLHQAGNRNLTGIIGYGRYSGDFCQIVPFIIIGSYVHTGKGSTFGMGAYEVPANSG
jgi:hypothetical protein